MSKSNEFKVEGLKHGGRILAAAEKYAIPKEEWIDLSTGLNPKGWPVPAIPASSWQGLPDDDDGLQAAACQYYGCESCLPVPGSQAAIQVLPTLRSVSKVGVISPTYAEHEYNWRQAGHDVRALKEDEVDSVLKQLDVLVVINPNNPTGKIIEHQKLFSWHQQLSTRGGWLIIDEAFMDVLPGNSLLSAGIKPGLIVLRSIGKFFGLAGIRCGFVISDKELLQLIANKLGPWSLTNPTRYVAKLALVDKVWQEKTRNELENNSRRLKQLLSDNKLKPEGGTNLFQWLNHSQAKNIYEILASKGILIRYYDNQGLRFGLPANEQHWQKLSDALSSLKIVLVNKTGHESYV